MNHTYYTLKNTLNIPYINILNIFDILIFGLVLGGVILGVSGCVKQGAVAGNASLGSAVPSDSLSNAGVDGQDGSWCPEGKSIGSETGNVTVLGIARKTIKNKTYELCVSNVYVNSVNPGEGELGNTSSQILAFRQGWAQGRENKVGFVENFDTHQVLESVVTYWVVEGTAGGNTENKSCMEFFSVPDTAVLQTICS
ncbi:hypothetical protein COY95_01020 [Candidatus Woesearchaeota archaeon CG_4_10_14_0_8_um_filter_47_5]|nr:MAG: hypothetical protein COY95_01020 [Candidatus Woesearchaeota archaeon CG_4_10_14_0_8_um_filter_47_5]